MSPHRADAALSLIHIFTLREHPALYQLIIRDNGTTASQPRQSDGLGLRNMAERVEALGGHFHVTFQDGVTLFLSIPKEVRHANPEMCIRDRSRWDWWFHW